MTGTFEPTPPPSEANESQTPGCRCHPFGSGQAAGLPSSQFLGPPRRYKGPIPSTQHTQCRKPVSSARTGSQRVPKFDDGLHLFSPLDLTEDVTPSRLPPGWLSAGGPGRMQAHCITSKEQQTAQIRPAAGPSVGLSSVLISTPDRTRANELSADTERPNRRVGSVLCDPVSLSTRKENPVRESRDSQTAGCLPHVTRCLHARHTSSLDEEEWTNNNNLARCKQSKSARPGKRRRRCRVRFLLPPSCCPFSLESKLALAGRDGIG